MSGDGSVKGTAGEVSPPVVWCVSRMAGRSTHDLDLDLVVTGDLIFSSTGLCIGSSCEEEKRKNGKHTEKKLIKDAYSNYTP